MGRAEGRKLEQELLSEHSDLELWRGEEKYPSFSTLIKIENESFDQNTFTGKHTLVYYSSSLRPVFLTNTELSSTSFTELMSKTVFSSTSELSST